MAYLSNQTSFRGLFCIHFNSQFRLMEAILTHSDIYIHNDDKRKNVIIILHSIVNLSSVAVCRVASPLLFVKWCVTRKK